MKLYKKFIKRLENGIPDYCNEKLCKDLESIAENHFQPSHKEQNDCNNFAEYDNGIKRCSVCGEEI